MRIRVLILQLLLPTFFISAALILACFALAGSTSNDGYLTNIQLIRFNLTGLNIPAVLNTNESVVIDLIEYENITAREVGLAEYYTFGLWGYCKGNMGDNEKINYTYCSKPTSLFSFDVVEIFTKEIVDYNQTFVGEFSKTHTPLEVGTYVVIFDGIVSYLQNNSIILPNSIEYKFQKIHGVDKMNFATTVLSIICEFVTLVVLLLSFLPYKNYTNRRNLKVGLQICTVTFGLLAFILFILCAGGCTSMYVNKKELYNKTSNIYGIRADVTYPFYALLWSACFCSLMSNILWISGNFIRLDIEEKAFQRKDLTLFE